MGAGVTDTTEAPDRARTDAIGRRYMIRFEEDTLKQRPLWTRVIIEFLGTALLVTVAAGAGVINRYAGGRERSARPARASASVATARRQSHRTTRHRSPPRVRRSTRSPSMCQVRSMSITRRTSAAG